jgi:hypothetical protein
MFHYYYIFNYISRSYKQHFYKSTHFRYVSVSQKRSSLEFPFENQHHRLRSWPVPIIKIKTAPSIHLTEVPGVHYPSLYIDTAASRFGFQSFFFACSKSFF